MPLPIGTRFGPYEIAAPLGAGGMGEVYRARDTRLDRSVAVKVLAPAVAQDAERRSRFEREAKAIAALTHPHVCTLYDVGTHEDTAYLVMELVDGQTLAARLEKGALPLSEALTVAAQVADALAAAHRIGIVHRDIKPANIMLTKSGVKLLDFGLAKLRTTTGPVSLGVGSQTGTATATGTAEGTILGTIHYMAPEQVEGKDADHRADIWAMGAVLYEMVTGVRPFTGDTAASVVGAILKEPTPIVGERQPTAPLELDRIIAGCLDKSLEDRWHSASDVRRQLRALPVGQMSVRRDADNPRRTWPVAVGATVVAGLLVGVWALTLRQDPATSAPRMVRLEAKLTDDGSLVLSQGPAFALSPDGATIAFVARRLGEVPRLFVRRLEQLAATEIKGTEDARTPFFSPDGQWIGFFAEGRLKKVPAVGGEVIVLCDGSGRGASWGDDDAIVFTPSASSGTTLFRVSANGGTPSRLTTLREREASHRWPQVLPGARAVLYSVSENLGNHNDGQVMLQPLPDGEPKVVVTGGYFGRYLHSGHLSYVRDGRVFAVPFDIDRLEVVGLPVPVLDRVSRLVAAGSAQFDVSTNGTVAYLAEDALDQQPLRWLTRDGRIQPLGIDPVDWSNPRISPNGRRVAFDVFDGTQTDIWIHELDRGTTGPLTLDRAEDWMPVWSPDGQRVAYRSSRLAPAINVYWQSADGSGQATRATASPNAMFATSWHPTEDVIAVAENHRITGYDILLLRPRVASPSEPGPVSLLNSPAQELMAAFSPDGKWIAYVSNESGSSSVYVRPYPGPGVPRMVAPSGSDPTWSRARNELLFMGLDQRLMIVNYRVEGGAFQYDAARPWSSARAVPRARGPVGHDGRGFDVHPDGERVVGAWLPELASVPVNDTAVLIFNFFDELRRLAPPAR